MVPVKPLTVNDVVDIAGFRHGRLLPCHDLGVIREPDAIPQVKPGFPIWLDVHGVKLALRDVAADC
jgi:hypothetical protein